MVDGTSKEVSEKQDPWSSWALVVFLGITLTLVIIGIAIGKWHALKKLESLHPKYWLFLGCFWRLIKPKYKPLCQIGTSQIFKKWIQDFYKLTVMVFWFYMMPLTHKITTNIFLQKLPDFRLSNFGSFYTIKNDLWLKNQAIFEEKYLW